MAAPPSSSYCILDPQRLHTRRWGDEAVVYDDRSGHTHLLGALAITVLTRLLEGPSSRNELLRHSGDADPKAVDEVLAQLVRLEVCIARARCG